MALWLASSLAGVAGALYAIREAVLDLRALGGSWNGRRLVNRQRLFAQLGRLVIFSCWSVLGLASIGAPNAPLSPFVVLLFVPNFVQLAILASDVYVGRELRE